MPACVVQVALLTVFIDFSAPSIVLIYPATARRVFTSVACPVCSLVTGSATAAYYEYPDKSATRDTALIEKIPYILFYLFGGLFIVIAMWENFLPRLAIQYQSWVAGVY